ncbi:uncharacterized protein LOC118512850 [Anopheles stephensi]|uniref:uncharacterized protein LOC118512850 n=1 Tax=Anopheles stephensi TaxID=30069 RepID=UPI001658AAF2|nr:uncharacterized protein LOC118512850 [Anopheles stephensi]XP_035913811.1 uncharacterized protein LOC118512850 [Anopheles stephensi]XP_035913812.1 uncharacterized protein LOC118512850 [Anopheles stephensi]XP_035913813.1 uncharacterized protein LOC118512850 [Anopheles stephensi]
MIPSRSFNHPNNVSYGRSSISTIQATYKPTGTGLPGTPDTSSGLCNEYTPTMRPPEHQNSWNVPASNEFNCSSPSVVSLLLETDDNDEDPVPVLVNENDPSEHVVVKDGYTFYIRYVDEPTSEGPLEERSSADEDACEVESLPSISNELSRLMDDIMLPEGAITTLEHTESSARDWINYDELPLLLNRQKLQQQQQQRRSVTSTGHVSLPASDTLVENERSKDYANGSVKTAESQPASNAGFSGCYEMFPPFTATPPLPSLEGFSQHNGSGLLKNGSSNSSSGQTPNATMVPDFSHYCVECEKFFPSNDLLQVHMELNHRLFGDDESLIAMATSTPQRAAFGQPPNGYGGRSGALVWPCAAIVDSTNQCPKRAFFCDSCNISFDLVESYYMHNNSVHGGVGALGTDYR